MNKITCLILAVVTITMFFSSCKKDDGLEIENPLEVIEYNLGITDREQSYSVNMVSDTIYYVYQYSNEYRNGSSVSKVNLYLSDMLNFLLSNDDYGYYGNGRHSKYSIASVGEVKSLKKINDIPTTGWAETISATPGTGYVIKAEGSTLDESYNESSRIKFTSYARVYIVSWIEGSMGGINGAVIQYQPNWKKVYEKE